MSRVAKTFDTRQDAISYGRERAKRDCFDCSLVEVTKVFGISREMVRQIKGKALVKLGNGFK